MFIYINHFVDITVMSFLTVTMYADINMNMNTTSKRKHTHIHTEKRR